MAEKKRKKKSRKAKMRARMIAVIAGAVLTLLLLFLVIFQVRYVTVTGNTKYTDEEIRQMVMEDVISNNSVLASIFRKHVDMSEIPFMEFVEIEYLTNNSIAIDVSEKKPIGYIYVKNNQVFFDKDGVAIEIIPFEPEYQENGDTPSGETALTADNLMPEDTSENLTEETESSGSEVEGIQSEDVQSARVSVSEFQPLLEDVPLVTGIYVQEAHENEVLDVNEPSLFRTMLALIRMIEKYNISPESVEIKEDGTLILHYFKSVRVNLGVDEELEEKMTKLAAILPEMEGMSGILHMENYKDESHSFVFEKDASDDLTPDGSANIPPAEG